MTNLTKMNRAFFKHEIWKMSQPNFLDISCYLSHMKNAAGECLGQTCSQQKEYVHNIQARGARGGAWVEQSGGWTCHINLSVDIMCWHQRWPSPNPIKSHYLSKLPSFSESSTCAAPLFHPTYITVWAVCILLVFSVLHLSLVSNVIDTPIAVNCAENLTTVLLHWPHMDTTHDRAERLRKLLTWVEDELVSTHWSTVRGLGLHHDTDPGQESQPWPGFRNRHFWAIVCNIHTADKFSTSIH